MQCSGPGPWAVLSSRLLLSTSLPAALPLALSAILNSTVKDGRCSPICRLGAAPTFGRRCGVLRCTEIEPRCSGPKKLAGRPRTEHRVSCLVFRGLSNDRFHLSKSLPKGAGPSIHNGKLVVCVSWLGPQSAAVRRPRAAALPGAAVSRCVRPVLCDAQQNVSAWQ